MAVQRPKLTTLLSALLIILGCQSAEADAPAAGPPAPEVSVARVLAQPLHDWQEFTGRLEERHRVDVRPRVAGFIDSVHFDDGARVRRGQLLFKIDPRPFLAAVGRWEGEVERANSALELARLNHERGQRLLASKVIATEVADRLRSEEVSARGALNSSAASLREARLNQEFSEVRAPIDGVASRALIQPGNLVNTQSVLTTLVSEGAVLAYFDADERTYLRLREAQRKAAGDSSAPGVFLARADETGYPHEGRLDFVDNAVDPRTGLITLRARFDNADGALSPGLFVRLQLVLPNTRLAVLIEDRAIGTDLGKKFVLVLRPDETLEYREITLGAPIGGLRVVEAGLRPDDVVVVNGLFRARSGMKVVPKRVAMDGAPAQLSNVQGVPGPNALALSGEPQPSAVR